MIFDKFLQAIYLFCRGTDHRRVDLCQEPESPCGVLCGNATKRRQLSLAGDDGMLSSLCAEMAEFWDWILRI